MVAPARPSALVLLNPAAAGGTAPARYARVQEQLTRMLTPHLVVCDPGRRWHEHVEASLREGIRVFIAAGGDGTVHALLNALERLRGPVPLKSLVLGAVGLGSSNDFHKPFDCVVDGVPLKIDPRAPGRRDLCRGRFTDEQGLAQQRFFTVSASLGFVAEGNRFFNEGDWLQRVMKKRSTPAAILYTTLRTLAAHRNLSARIQLGDEDFETAMTGLSVLKTPYVSGGFRVDTPAAADDGLFGVNLCAGLGRLGMLRVLLDLSRGQFLGRPGRSHWRVRELRVCCDRPVTLEFDGEVFHASEIHFEVLDDWIGACR